MLGWVCMLRTKTLPESKWDHALEVIERNANAQNQLLADLLDSSRIVAGKLKLDVSPVDLSSTVALAAEAIRPSAEKKNIRIEVVCDPDIGIVGGDAGRLSQITSNLLANAVKFTPRGGSVRISLGRTPSGVELGVTDTGVGIAPDFLLYFFFRFRQCDSGSTRWHGGLVLGLSIARHLVELHGGTISVESEGAGHGATFTVRLPAGALLTTDADSAELPAVAPGPALIVARCYMDGVRVLVVDDEADARDLLVAVLETCNVIVRTSGSATEALDQLAEFQPDVVVSDVGMQDDDGYMLVRKIRSLPVEEQRRVPIVALTAYAAGEDRTRALLAGFNAHIAKPVEPARLIGLIAELSGRINRTHPAH
jgi:CheY-like chemotaxis protein